MFTFLNEINENYYDEVNRIFYYNPQQHRFYDKIVYLVEKYGEPKLIKDNGKLRIRFLNSGNSESLFVCMGPVLVAVAVYLTEDEKISIVHIAVNHGMGKYPKLHRQIPLRIVEYFSTNPDFSKISTIENCYLSKRFSKK